MRYAIKLYGAYLMCFDPVSGRSQWTRDVALAKTWATREEAAALVECGEEVVEVGM